MRIVSLTCSNTEIVCHLGLRDQLVGVDDHSDFPADALEGVPRVGPDLQIDVERVAALEPDIVLASLTVPGHEKVVESLRIAGLPYVAPEPKSLADVARDLRELGTLLGVPERGRRAAREFDAELDELAVSAEGAAGRSSPRVLIQWWPKPVIVPGRSSWAQGLLDLVGARNVLDEDVESRPLREEELGELEVDLVVLSWCGVEAHKVRPDVVIENPRLQSTAAVRNGHVACVPEAWLGRPSQRLVSGARALSRIVDAVRNGQDLPSSYASAEESARQLRLEARRMEEAESATPRRTTVS